MGVVGDIDVGATFFSWASRDGHTDFKARVRDAGMGMLECACVGEDEVARVGIGTPSCPGLWKVEQRMMDSLMYLLSPLTR